MVLSDPVTGKGEAGDSLEMEVGGGSNSERQLCWVWSHVTQKCQQVHRTPEQEGLCSVYPPKDVTPDLQKPQGH